MGFCKNAGEQNSPPRPLSWTEPSRLGQISPLGLPPFPNGPFPPPQPSPADKEPTEAAPAAAEEKKMEVAAPAEDKKAEDAKPEEKKAEDAGQEEVTLEGEEGQREAQ